MCSAAQTLALRPPEEVSLDKLGDKGAPSYYLFASAERLSLPGHKSEPQARAKDTYSRAEPIIVLIMMILLLSALLAAAAAGRLLLLTSKAGYHHYYHCWLAGLLAGSLACLPVLQAVQARRDCAPSSQELGLFSSRTLISSLNLMRPLTALLHRLQLQRRRRKKEGELERTA